MDIVNLNSNISIKKKNSDRKINLDDSLFSFYKSPKTLKDYMFYLKDFLSFIYEDVNISNQSQIIQMMIEITKVEIEEYISHLINERKLKKTSINKIIFALKSLYKELEKRDLPNPIKFFPTLKVNKFNYENILKLSYSEIKKILKIYKIKDDKTFRDYTILITLFYTGMRSSELLNLKYKNILQRNEDFVLKLEKTKSGKEQFKPLHNKAYEKIMNFKRYIQNLYSIDDEQINEVFIFSSNFEKNKPMSYHNLYRIIQNMGILINKNISPHNIRHTVATELSLNGADILEIRDFLGHADSKVTEIYINARNILEKKAINRLPDIDDFLWLWMINLNRFLQHNKVINEFGIDYKNYLDENPFGFKM